jgi:hypothetical protein
VVPHDYILDISPFNGQVVRDSYSTNQSGTALNYCGEVDTCETNHLKGTALSVTRVNSTNVQYEGLRIEGAERRMNSKVNQSNKVYIESKRKNKLGLLSICPLLSPIYRWPGLKEWEGSDTDYSIDI